MKHLITRRVSSIAVILVAFLFHVHPASALYHGQNSQKTAGQETVITSLPKEFVLSGKQLLLIGETEKPDQLVQLEVWRENTTKAAFTTFIHADKEQIFVEVVDLTQLCVLPSEKRYTLIVDGEPRHLFTMHCEDSVSVYPFENMDYAGKSLKIGEQPGDLRLSSPTQATFEALGQPWMRAFTAYASVVMSRDMYVGNQGRISVSPWEYLPPGEHHFYMAPYDPIRKIVYSPLVVPFTLQGGIGEQLKATIYYAPGAASILLLVFFGSVLYIRRVRSTKRGITLVGEEYPDEVSANFTE